MSCGDVVTAEGSAGRARSGLVSVALVAGLNVLGLVMAMMLAISDDTAVAAFFPPWWSEAQAVEVGGTAGTILRMGRLPTLVLVHATRPGLARRLWAAGAILVLPTFRFGPCGADAQDTIQ